MLTIRLAPPHIFDSAVESTFELVSPSSVGSKSFKHFKHQRPSAHTMGVCAPASNTAAWAFSAPKGTSYSCASSAGGTNDLGTAPTQCAGDPASVRIAITPGKAECLVASAPACKIPMHDFVSMDYDFSVNGCNGIWAAPLWMTPDTWQWGAGSGEIDSLEFCSRDSVHMNFAGGGHQVETALSIDSSAAHITVRKDPSGIVTVTACTAAEASANADQCIAPVYADCDACQAGNNTFACWCNAGANNIYGSGGCVAGTDCMWTLVSDAWNGVSGDAGYAGCMTAVPGVVDKDKPNLKSRCALSVEKIVLRGGGLNESLRWGHGSPHSCDVLTVPHRPNPSTPPPAASPARRASPPPLQPTTPWWRVSRGASNGAAR
jgi:hypothetical protein